MKTKLEKAPTGFGSPEHLAALHKGIEISKSGYGGCLPTGEIVDRREHPKAIPLQKNIIFGTPEPLPLPAKQKGAK